MVLSKDEKKARKAARIAAKKAKAEELRLQLKRDELAREVAAHALWAHSLEKALRTAMLKIKKPEYRQQIEVMLHALDRAYDKKDGVINHLIQLKGIADNQYQRTIANFCQITDTIITTFLSNLDEMAKKNEVRVRETLEHGKCELDSYLDNHKGAETHLNMLLYAGHVEADALVWNTRGENAVRRDEDSTTYLEIRDHLKYLLEGAYCGLWEQYKATVKSYLASTAENQKEVRKLRKKENTMADIIAAQTKQITLSAKQIKRLRLDLLAYETGEKQAEFRDRRERHRTAFFRLKKCMSQGVEVDEKQLLTLVKASDDAVGWLERAYKKVEKILRLASLCRKFETQREKVLPFGSVVPVEIQTNEKQQIAGEDCLNVVDLLTSSDGLAKLWHRISRAELVSKALLREKVQLERENAFIGYQMQMQDADVSLNTFQCLCQMTNVKKSIRQPCAIDGNLEIKKYKYY